MFWGCATLGLLIGNASNHHWTNVGANAITVATLFIVGMTWWSLKP
jgi:hypothetical protein